MTFPERAEETAGNNRKTIAKMKCFKIAAPLPGGTTSAFHDTQNRAPQKATVVLPMIAQMLFNGLPDLVQDSLCDILYRILVYTLTPKIKATVVAQEACVAFFSASMAH